MEYLISFEGKKVKVILRNNRILQGLLLLQGNIVLIKDSEKHAVLVIPQEIVQIEEVD